VVKKGELMLRVIMFVAAIALFSNVASADETPKYQSIWHTTFVQSQNIPDTDGHIVAVIRNEGVASFPDGTTAIDQFAGTIDYTKGSGPAITYGEMTFSGAIDAIHKINRHNDYRRPANDFQGHNNHHWRQGPFRWGKGDGTFTGGRRQPQPGAGAHLYGDIILNVKK
jgi:hypothetical protein